MGSWGSHVPSLGLKYLTYKMKSLDIMTSLEPSCADNPCAFGTHSYNGKILRECFHWITVQIWEEVYEVAFSFGMISLPDSSPVPAVLTFNA